MIGPHEQGYCDGNLKENFFLIDLPYNVCCKPARQVAYYDSFNWDGAAEIIEICSNNLRLEDLEKRLCSTV